MDKSLHNAYLIGKYRTFLFISSLAFSLMLVLPVIGKSNVLHNASAMVPRKITNDNAYVSTGNEERKIIDDELTLFKTSDKKTLVGREAILSNLTVTSQLSDRAFLVGNKKADQLLVAIENVDDPYSVNNTSFLNKGQKIVIGGTIQRMPKDNVFANQWHVDKATIAGLKTKDIYLSARVILVPDTNVQTTETY